MPVNLNSTKKPNSLFLGAYIFDCHIMIVLYILFLGLPIFCVVLSLVGVIRQRRWFQVVLTVPVIVFSSLAFLASYAMMFEGAYPSLVPVVISVLILPISVGQLACAFFSDGPSLLKNE